MVSILNITAPGSNKALRFGELPEGVLRLGGTFALDRDIVLYSYEEGVPGDTPNVDNVIAVFQTSSLFKMKNADLKAILRKNKLAVSGNKATMIERITRFVIKGNKLIVD